MMTRGKSLLADTLDGYIRGGYLVAANGRILATITSHRDSLAYGPLCRRYVRATDDGGQMYAGSCPSDSDHIILRKVKR